MMNKITTASINGFYCFYNLKDKTQMIKNIDKKEYFLNRMQHTLLVADTTLEIVEKKRLEQKNIDKDRLYCSALLHDVGHTPYGHAGEEKINELFFSKDEINYSKHNSGSFKHNLNSVRLVGHYFKSIKIYIDSVLVDSILKHGLAFPKQYDYSRFQEEDILEQNYILRSVFFAKSTLLKDFLKQYLVKTNSCTKMSKNCVTNKNACHYCEKQKNHLCYCNPKFTKYGLSMYLSYPYPLTCEGTILYWADEIACLCGDILDLLLLVKYLMIKGNKSSILFSKFKCLINLLLARYENQMILNIILDCINIVENKTIDLDTCKKDLKNKLINLHNDKSLISLLILSLQTDHIKDNKVDINFNGNQCDLLFKMDDTSYSIYKIIKDQIYSEIHSYRYIEKVNSNGKTRIKQVCRMFFKDLCLFMREFNNITFGKRDSVYNDIGSALYSILRIHEKGVSKSAFIDSFKSEFSDLSKPISLSFKSLSETGCLRKYLQNNSEGKERVFQLLQREVLQFVATLPEETIEKYYLENKYPVRFSNKTYFPKDYYL